MLAAGGDPYSRAYAELTTGDPNHSAFPYPLGSLWLVVPFAALPIDWAALAWIGISAMSLLITAPLLGIARPRWIWFVPLLFYPSLYALKITQWAPAQMALLALSLYLYRRGGSFWAGFLVPLTAVKPTTGLGLLVFAAVFCARDWRWWRGVVAGGMWWYGLPLLVMPDWPLRWLDTLRVYGSAAEGQGLVSLIALPDGKLCAAAGVLIALWSLWRGRALNLACALLILAMLVTPHRAQADYPVFCIPLLFLPRRHFWLVATALALSWLFPLTFELGWQNSLQLTLMLAAPATLACALVEASSTTNAAQQRFPGLREGARAESATRPS
jgi:hypothetical protein